MYIDKTYQNINMNLVNNILFIKELQNEFPYLFFVPTDTPTGRRLRVYGNITEEEFERLNKALEGQE